MASKLLIDGSQIDQTKVALVSDFGLEDFEFESNSQKHLKGNIYLGKISRIEPSLQAAFVDIGSEKNGFLAFGEIHPNYFQIPIADREALLKEEADQQDLHNNENQENTEEETDKQDESLESDPQPSNLEHEALADHEDSTSNEKNDVPDDNEVTIDPDDLPPLEKEKKTKVQI